jgi:hypothetical protein
MRSLAKRQDPKRYVNRVKDALAHEKKMEPFRDTTDELDVVFHEVDDDLE